MTAAQVARRDGWTCWICAGEVDQHAPVTSPVAPSVDHVVPRARGGSNEPANLRLAHRGCNGRRGSRLPELDWPVELRAVEPAPLWPVVQRALRRPGEWEVVGVALSRDRASAATTWLAEALGQVLGAGFETRSSLTAAGWHLLALRRTPADPRPRHRGARR
ncbi:MAG: hypothetical protein NVSMB13_17110 [Mycobacteriales bacterium]